MILDTTVKLVEEIGKYGSKLIITTIVDDIKDFKEESRGIFAKTAEEQLKKIAEHFIEENKSDILKHLDPQAIANLAIADSARLVREKFIDPPTKKENK